MKPTCVQQIKNAWETVTCAQKWNLDVLVIELVPKYDIHILLHPTIESYTMKEKSATSHLATLINILLQVQINNSKTHNTEMLGIFSCIDIKKLCTCIITT